MNLLDSVVSVTSIRPLTGAGSLKAFASVTIGDITIHDLRIIQQLGQKAWVSLPQKEYTTKAGERKFSAVVEVSDTLKRMIQRVVLGAWEQREAA